MTTQVADGVLYLAQYAGRSGMRVEVQRANPPLGNNSVADVTWEEFKRLVALGQQLIEKCEGQSEVPSRGPASRQGRGHDER